MASISAYASRAVSRWPSVEKFSDTSSKVRFRRLHDTETTLTAAELDEEIERKLESKNILAGKSVVQFNYGTGEYENAPTPSPLMKLFSLKSYAVLKSAENTDEILENSETDDDELVTYLSTRTKKERKIPNAFDSREEATQTDDCETRDAEVQTSGLETRNANGSVSASEIYDFYVENLKKNKEKMMPVLEEKNKSLIYMERAINQNIFESVNYDFGYYEDPADEFRTDGSLLPLWRFYIPGQNIPVRGIEWSKINTDIFAIAFGDDEKTGAVAVFSLKCPLLPEYLRETTSPVLCVSIHPKIQSLLAIGQLDGHVAVYDAASPKNGPQYISESGNKHLNGVYAITWNTEEELGFFSNSADGYVQSWRLFRNNMEATVLKKIIHPLSTTLESILPGVHGCGFRFEFHPTDPNIYLLGTSEGLILKCTMLLNTSSMFTYEAHALPINCIAFNPFLPEIFLSCSSDWCVKIWSDEQSEPLSVFNLNYAVMDAEWAPFSSTVFSAVTVDGFVHIFDLFVDSYRAIYKQRVVSSLHGNKPTRQAFNPNHPMLVVGDRNGRITTLKLSPNLRIPAKGSKKENVDQKILEIWKLEKILKFMKPGILKTLDDVPCIE